MVVISLRPDLRVRRVGRVVELPVDVHKAGRACEFSSIRDKKATDFATRGCRVLRNGDDAELKLNMEEMASSKPSSTRIGTASVRADLTSELKMLLPLTAAVIAEVKFEVCSWTSRDKPGIGMPRMSSTARIT